VTANIGRDDYIRVLCARLGESVEFRILGPLEVADNEGGTVSLPAGRARVVLALLCLRAGQVVASDALIDAAWDGTPPPTAVTRLQGFVSALRRAFGEGGKDVIVTGDNGYALRADTDLARFRALTQDSDRDRVEQALALWRGRPFSGLNCAELETAADLIEQEYVSALEDYAGLELALGEYAAVVSAVSGWTKQYPLRERLRALLIEALSKSGRQADALEAYHALRRLLADELGVDPSPELRDLYQRILAGEQEVLTVLPAQVPAVLADFTGRDLEVKELCDTLAAGNDGVVIAAVTGTGGIGKSALAARVAHLVKEHFPHGQLYVNLAGTAKEPAVPGDVQARLMRDLGVSPRHIPASGEEREVRYRSVLADKRLLLVLDDAKDAAQVRPLLPGTGGCAVLITSRARLADLAGVSRCDLPELEPADALALFSRIAGADRADAEPAAVEAILGSCGGLPLAIRIVAAKLAARPRWSVADLASRIAMAESGLRELECGDLAVRACFTPSFDGLDERPARAFRLLGLTPPGTLPLGAIGALHDMGVSCTEEILETLADGHLIESPAIGYYRLHDLLRLFASELAATDDERPVALRRLLGWYGAALWSAASVLAQGRHLPPGAGSAAWPAEPHWDVPVFGGYSEAYDWAQREEASLLWAMRTAADCGWHELATGLAGLFGLYASRSDSLDAYSASQRIGAEAADGQGDELVQAWFMSGLTTCLRRAGDFDGAIECAQRALALRQRAGDRRAEAASYSALANVQISIADKVQDSVENYRVAAAISEELGDDLMHAIVLNNMACAFGKLDDADGALFAFRRAVEVVTRTPDRYSEAIARSGFGQSLRGLGQLEQALDQHHRAVSLLRELGMANEALMEALTNLGATLDALGRSGESRRYWEEAAALDAAGVAHAEQSRHRLAASGYLTLTGRR
jgi:DNA-binding SARP family transcriptional activator